MKFEQAVENYLNAKISGRKPIRPNTLEGYLSAIRCHLMPKWAGREMESITSDELQEWVDGFDKTGEVDISKGMHEAFGNVYESPTKTEKSTRTVILPRYAVERLRAIRRDVCPSRHDRLVDMRPSAYRRRVRAWFARRGIKMCAQWLRHSWGTLAVQAGVKIETVALMLGHESLDTAYEHYLVSNSTLLKDAQRQFEAALMAG